MGLVLCRFWYFKECRTGIAVKACRFEAFGSNASCLTRSDQASSFSVIMRTIVDLPDHQIAALAELCNREHISRAEAVRRALDAMLKEKQPVAREAAFGAWAPRGDSQAVVETLREEWTR